MSLETMETWGYITEIPEGIGGDRPSAEGTSLKCERCQADYRVEKDFGANDCFYHWGKVRTTKVAGMA